MWETQGTQDQIEISLRWLCDGSLGTGNGSQVPAEVSIAISRQPGGVLDHG